MNLLAAEEGLGDNVDLQRTLSISFSDPGERLATDRAGCNARNAWLSFHLAVLSPPPRIEHESEQSKW